MSSRFFKRIFAPGLLGLALLAVVLLATIGGGDSSARANNGDRGIARAIEAQEAQSNALFGISGVVGNGVGLDEDGNAVVVVLTDAPGVQGIPAKLDGVSTSVRVSGQFAALPGVATVVAGTAVAARTRTRRPVSRSTVFLQSVLWRHWPQLLPMLRMMPQERHSISPGYPVLTEILGPAPISS